MVSPHLLKIGPIASVEDCVAPVGKTLRYAVRCVHSHRNVAKRVRPGNRSRYNVVNARVGPKVAQRAVVVHRVDICVVLRRSGIVERTATPRSKIRCHPVALRERNGFEERCRARRARPRLVAHARVRAAAQTVQAAVEVGGARGRGGAPRVSRACREN